MPIRSATAAFGLAAALLCSNPVGAAPHTYLRAVVHTENLTLEAVLALARERAPALVEARARVQAARGAVAGAAPLLHGNPQVDVQAGPRRLVTGARTMDVAAGVSQPFELGGQQGLRREAARAGLAREEALLRDAERLVVGEVASAFLRVLHAQERLKLANAALQAASDTVLATGHRFDAGDVPILDFNVARAARARIRVEATNAEGEVNALQDELRALLGVSFTEAASIQGDLRALALAPLRGPGGDKKLERSDLTALEEQEAQAQATATLGRREALPDVSLGVRYQREANETVLLGTLSVPLPLFARGQEARISAEAQVVGAQKALKAARQAVSNQMNAARIRFNARVEALDVFEQEGGLLLLTDNEALARRSYDAGELDLAGFMLIRRDVMETRAAWLDSLLQAGLARVRYAVEMGVSP
ncbi:TolC family protein [Corallococcus sicarius]|uniref:TolC family protein n=1 Tax=Corallococcus sicarius TaxID=2316726 RepID=A0A3A8NSL7_9BACT|nr:TolC family protein [Corallococcus sicarius]RKH46479.1 TolC family protein [Corallococcus sicarius]